jgi:hypothetical protein
MAWTIDRGETVLALRYTVALWRYWRQLGEFAEGRRWLNAALALAGNAAPSLRAKALRGAVGLAFPQADHTRMAELAAEAIGLAHLSGVSEERWQRSWDRGRALDPAAAVAYALANRAE